MSRGYNWPEEGPQSSPFETPEAQRYGRRLPDSYQTRHYDDYLRPESANSQSGAVSGMPNLRTQQADARNGQAYDATASQPSSLPVGSGYADHGPNGATFHDSYPLQDYPARPSRYPSAYTLEDNGTNGSFRHDDYGATPSPYHAQANGSGYFGSGDLSYGAAGDGRPPDEGMKSPLLDKYPKELQELPSPGEPYQPGSRAYTPVPDGPQPRRYKTMKRIELFHGNLVLDCPVPKQLLDTLPIKEGREYTHMRYSAATGDPSEFKSKLFTLRQALYQPVRQTELFIVITMYNESEVLFARTMHSVMKNIAHLCSRNRSRMWGENGWQKVVVCIVSDGRDKINKRTLSYLAAMGVYQEGIAKNVVNNEPVTAHIYEYTAQISINDDLVFHGSEKGIVPVQVLFCLKEKNQKKINSHRWFFQAFGSILNPNICVLLDAGTQPGKHSIYHLWKAFDLNSNVAGACGEIVAMKGPYGRNLLNPLVAAQNFEYKMSNILDKPLESVFGFISVLPGAFSAYRFVALQNDATGRGPLSSYFKGETMHGANAGIFEANMYLAEDRILCFELVAKRNSAWVLHYVKSAYAATDVPDELPELISQRRRWLNGSFFAAVYALAHTFDIWRSDHGFFRKIFFHIEFLYQGISMLFSWFALGNFFIAFTILAKALAANVWVSGPLVGQKIFAPGYVLYAIATWIYAALIVMCFVLSLGNRPQGSKWAYMGTLTFFAILMGYLIFAAGFLSYVSIEEFLNNLRSQVRGTVTFSQILAVVRNNSLFWKLVVSLLSTYGLYIVASLLYFEPWHMFTSFVQYLLISPSYINIMNVYAFCNTHDISWGTKGDTAVKTDLGVVKVTKDGTMEVAVPTNETDINQAYSQALQTLSSKAAEAKQKRDPRTKQEDYYKAFRTRVVIFWILTNGALVGGILGAGLDTLSTTTQQAGVASIYLGIIFWSVAALSAFRFVGCVLYLLIRLVHGE